MIIQVQEGKLKGIEKSSILTGQPFCAFLGIPYAKPPIGELRFKDPVPIGDWDGIWDASNEGSDCFQVEAGPPLGQELTGSEDCLYLNVYTPEPPSRIKNRKAVMVFIHGGGFRCESGSAKYYGPDFLICHDVIYVSLNYRLHVFGFLNTGTPNCSGNAGLKDQLLAMKWVKKNIASFGGDPDNITLFGESAGATSVHLQTLSPLSKGLFKRAILQSGTALSSWAIERDPELQARKIGQLAGYNGHDLEGLVAYLKTLPGRKLCELAHRCHEDAHKLMEAALVPTRKTQQHIYLPRIERENPGRCVAVMFIPSVEKIKDGAFLPDFPEKLMNSSTTVPTIIGCTDQEGLLLFHAQAKESIDLVLDDLSIAVKENFDLNETERTELLTKIQKFYLQNQPVTPKSLEQVMNLYADLYFIKFYEAIDYLIKSDVPPYIYLFTYDGKFNFIKNEILKFFNSNVRGVAHGDELWYLFSQTVGPYEMDDAVKKIIYHFCVLWTNFAKTGHPTSSPEHLDWKPHTIDRPCYLRIDEPLKVFDEKLFEERLNFWKDWKTKFYR